MDIYTENDPIKNMIPAVIEAYKLYRRVIHPNWEASPRWDKCWWNTARLLSDTGWPADEYMCVQFQHVVPFPQPNQLYNDNAKMNMLKAIGERSPAAETRTKITAEISFWKSRLAVFKKPDTVLQMAASNPGISSLFLFCAARQFNLDGTQWRDKAIETMRLKPVADEYRKALILTPAIEAEISECLMQRH